ncbi:MAG: DNA-3-methyladenine glycosylase [Bacteroidota bacterium]
MKHLPRSFYTRRTLTVAKDLLGKYLVRKSGSRYLIGMIVETEAYRYNDPASHSYRGITERNSFMFRPGGFLYVYFTYGMHYCANVVTAREGVGEAVLIRAIEPVEGIDIMMKNRNIDDRSLKTISNGPAKCAGALGLTTRESGIDLTKSEIFITGGTSISRSQIVAATRIGISVGQDKLWRFYIKGNEWISKK